MVSAQGSATGVVQMKTVYAPWQPAPPSPVRREVRAERVRLLADGFIGEYL